MTRRTFTPEDRARALEGYDTLGPAECARRAGVAPSTLRSWASRAGVAAAAAQRVAAAVERRTLDLEERRQLLAGDLLTAAEEALQALHQPVAVYRAGTEGIVAGEAPRPSPRDRQALLVGAAVAIDKAQLLTGQATERTDDLGFDLEEASLEHGRNMAELERLRALHGEDDDGPDDGLRAV